MIADNNLDYYAIENIKKLERGIPDNAKGDIYVFIDRNSGGKPSHPYLLCIQRDTVNNNITSPILQTYKEDNTSDPDFLKAVIVDVQKYCAEQNSQLSRLVLWSHGTGWLPEGTSFDSESTGSLRSFGLDNTGSDADTDYKKEMDIKDLAIAVNEFHFDLLIMDACFMGNIETAYELKNSFKYMLLSPSEILSTGFPYTDIAGDLVSDNLAVETVAEKFFNYYNNQNLALRSATISVINTEYLEELSFCMREVYQQYAEHNTFNMALPIETVVQYDRTYSNYFFDFQQFLNYAFVNTSNSYLDILSLLQNVQPYYRHTDTMFSTLDLSKTTGLSIYIPNNYEQREELHQYYKTLNWAKDSNAIILFE
jgi:hypothetical protein